MTISTLSIPIGVHIKRALLAACAGLLFAACASEAPTTPPLPQPPAFTAVDGDWRALYWIVQPAQGDSLDVITEGGSITLRITNGLIAGSMIVPDAVTQSGALTVDMTGLARPVGDRVHFDQTEDTFLELEGWLLLEGELFDALVLDHVVSASTVFTVVLVRGW